MKKPRNNGHTYPITPFRLAPSTLADLDVIREQLAAERQTTQSRADALRFAVSEAAKRIRKKKEQA